MRRTTSTRRAMPRLTPSPEPVLPLDTKARPNARNGRTRPAADSADGAPRARQSNAWHQDWGPKTRELPGANIDPTSTAAPHRATRSAKSRCAGPPIRTERRSHEEAAMHSLPQYRHEYAKTRP
jgi:hypothetical protein